MTEPETGVDAFTFEDFEASPIGALLLGIPALFIGGSIIFMEFIR